MRLESNRKALTIQQKLADANPSISGFQHQLAVYHTSRGMLLRATGKLEEALVSFRRALAIGTKLADANPSVGDLQNDVAAFHTNVGSLLAELGKSDDALKSFEAALARAAKLADASPSVTSFQHAVALSHSNIGRLLIVTRKPAGAEVLSGVVGNSVDACRRQPLHHRISKRCGELPQEHRRCAICDRETG